LLNNTQIIRKSNDERSPMFKSKIQRFTNKTIINDPNLENENDDFKNAPYKNARSCGRKYNFVTIRLKCKRQQSVPRNTIPSIPGIFLARKLLISKTFL